MSAQNAQRAAESAEEAQLLATIADADEAAAWLHASQLPLRSIVLETDSVEYWKEVTATSLLASFLTC